MMKVDLYAAGKPANGKRDAKPKTDEVLIEEILKAAGLEALD